MPSFGGKCEQSVNVISAKIVVSTNSECLFLENFSLYDTYGCTNLCMRTLSFIQGNVTVSEDCTNGQDIRASYELSYHTELGALNATCVVNWTECSSGVCHHELQSNSVDSRCQPPVSQFSGEDINVFLTARNMVGRSNPAVSKRISEFF